MHQRDRDTRFTEFVTAQRTSLVRTARLMTAGVGSRGPGLGRGLVQTTLTRLYFSWPKVRRAGNPVGYARTSLTHAFVDETRRAHRRRETTTVVPAEGVVRLADPDLRTMVLSALVDLPPRQRAVAVVQYPACVGMDARADGAVPRQRPPRPRRRAGAGVSPT